MRVRSPELGEVVSVSSLAPFLNQKYTSVVDDVESEARQGSRTVSPS